MEVLKKISLVTAFIITALLTVNMASAHKYTSKKNKTHYGYSKAYHSSRNDTAWPWGPSYQEHIDWGSKKKTKRSYKKKRHYKRSLARHKKSYNPQRYHSSRADVAWPSSYRTTKRYKKNKHRRRRVATNYTNSYTSQRYHSSREDVEWK